jgi:LmbE family N-acetylglucosaminyl deacetylase
MYLFLSPHCDDETLFGAYTIMRDKPLVAIYLSSMERMQESAKAMKVLGAPLMFIESIDTMIFDEFDVVYAPAIEGGHPLHDEIGRKALEKWGDKVIQYSTYRSGSDLLPRGSIKVHATEDMKKKKIEALKCYVSQIKETPCHFEQDNKDEYYV